MDKNSKPKLTKSEAGQLGGESISKRKRKAAVENGKRGGRPRKYATASERQMAYLERKRTEE